MKAGKHSSASLRPSSKCFFLHSKIFGEVLPFKIGNVKLPKATLVVHVADLSKYFSLFPALVVGPANRPHAAYKWETAGGAETHNQILSGYQRFNSISTRINIFYIYIYFSKLELLVLVLTDKAIWVLAVELIAIIQVESH